MSQICTCEGRLSVHAFWAMARPSPSTHTTSRLCWPRPQSTEHFVQFPICHRTHGLSSLQLCDPSGCGLDVHLSGPTVSCTACDTRCIQSTLLVCAPGSHVVLHTDHSPTSQSGGHGFWLHSTLCKAGLTTLSQFSSVTIAWLSVLTQTITVSMVPSPHGRVHSVKPDIFHW